MEELVLDAGIELDADFQAISKSDQPVSLDRKESISIENPQPQQENKTHADGLERAADEDLSAHHAHSSAIPASQCHGEEKDKSTTRPKSDNDSVFPADDQNLNVEAPVDTSNSPQAAVDCCESDDLQTALATRKQHLDDREVRLQAFHDQVTELHRESLELRVATEQLWNEMRGNMPDEALARTLSEYRNRLADHYKMAIDELSRRRDLLHQQQHDAQRQERQLRSERLDIQLWVDRQRNELEAKSAELAARELEFDRREADLQRQAVLWQKQREEYRHEIERLGRRLRHSVA